MLLKPIVMFNSMIKMFLMLLKHDMKFMLSDYTFKIKVQFN